MKKHLLFLIALLLSHFSPALAQYPQEPSVKKNNYLGAKAQIIDMLDGAAPLSYEKAIFLLENAWWDGQMDYGAFREIITDGIRQIKVIEKQNSYKAEPEQRDFFEALRQKANNDAGYINSAKTNFAIYTYITDTTVFFNSKDSISEVHYPYSYASSDPLGTIDWKNTQVVNLLLNGKGNCYAFASLFKICSERLNSSAAIGTAPGHVYITHKDNHGIQFNIELASRAFPGTGTLSTLTYTKPEAIRNNISLRELDTRQSVALTLVYLAKSYESKFAIQRPDSFVMACAETALLYDSLSLNALLLKAEQLEMALIETGKPIVQLQQELHFKKYESLLNQLYHLGYREMPLDMKNILIKGWTHDTVKLLSQTSYLKSGTDDTTSGRPIKYASLSWGLFDEDIEDKPIERYGRTLYDTRTNKIWEFVPQQTLYNNYSFDPVLFALNVDPLADKFPSISPYAFANNNPIYFVDPDGLAPNPFRIMADLFRSFTQQTTAGIIKHASQTGYFNRPGVSGNRTYAITRLGRIFQDAVLQSLGENENHTRFRVPGSSRSVEPDMVGVSRMSTITNLDPKDRDLMEFPNANFTDAKFKGFVPMTDEHNPDQLRGMIDVLSDMKGGYVNGSWDPNIKASDYGAASLTIITPQNTSIDPGIVGYATENNVILFQRTTEIDQNDPGRMRVAPGATQLNSVGTQPAGVNIPKGPGQSTEINYNIR